MPSPQQQPILEAFDFPIPEPRPTKKIFFFLQLMLVFLSFIFTGIAVAFYSLSVHGQFLKKHQRFDEYSWEVAILILVADILSRTLIGCILRRPRYEWVLNGSCLAQTGIIHVVAFIFTFFDTEVCKLFEGETENTVEMSAIIAILFSCLIGGVDAFFYIIAASMLRELFNNCNESICFRFRIMQCFSVAGALSFAYDGGTIAQVGVIILAATITLLRIIVVAPRNPLGLVTTVIVIN